MKRSEICRVLGVRSAGKPPIFGTCRERTGVAETWLSMGGGASFSLLSAADQPRRRSLPTGGTQIAEGFPREEGRP